MRDDLSSHTEERLKVRNMMTTRICLIINWVRFRRVEACDLSSRLHNFLTFVRKEPFWDCRNSGTFVKCDEKKRNARPHEIAYNQIIQLHFNCWLGEFIRKRKHWTLCLNFCLFQLWNRNCFCYGFIRSHAYHNSPRDFQTFLSVRIKRWKRNLFR